MGRLAFDGAATTHDWVSAQFWADQLRSGTELNGVRVRGSATSDYLSNADHRARLARLFLPGRFDG